MESSDDFLRLDLDPLATGDLERDLDLELECDRFLFRRDFEEDEVEVEVEPGLDLVSASSESLALSFALFFAPSLLGAAAVLEDVLLDCFTWSVLVNGC